MKTQLTLINKDREIQDALEQLIAYIRSIKGPDVILNITDLRPDHLVPKTISDAMRGEWSNPGVLTPGWNLNVFDYALKDTYGVVIYGVFNPSATPRITDLQFRIGGVDYPVFSLQDIKFREERWGYLDNPLIIKPKEAIAIHMRATEGVAAYAEKIGFLGKVVGEYTDLTKRSIHD